MKATGIVRKVDELGRIVLPKELRRTLNIEEKDALEIYVEGEQIILKKHVRGCVFCGEMGQTTRVKGKDICRDCINNLKKGGNTNDGNWNNSI